MILPAVTVIIPTYNQAQFVAQAIESVLAQTFNDYEIIVVNDASTDHTAQILGGYSDPRLHLINLEINVGAAITRNMALEIARGEFVAFLDADDLWYPQRLEFTIAYLQQNPTVDFVCGAWDHIDETGRTLEKLNQPAQYQSSLETDPLRALAVKGNLLATSALLIRRSCFSCCGTFDPALKRSMDWDLWLRLAAHGHKMVMLNYPVSRYRRHQTNLTLNPQRMEEAARQVLTKLFSNNQLTSRLAGLQEHAYLDSWLRIAQLAHEAGLAQESSRLVQMAADLYPKASPNEDLNINYLQKLISLPQTEQFMALIIASTPEAKPLYAWITMRRCFYSGNYLSALLKLGKLILSRPKWLLEKVTRRAGRELALAQTSSKLP